MPSPTTKTRVLVLIVTLEKNIEDLDRVVSSRLSTMEGIDHVEPIAYTDFIEPPVPAPTNAATRRMHGAGG